MYRLGLWPHGGPATALGRFDATVFRIPRRGRRLAFDCRKTRLLVQWLARGPDSTRSTTASPTRMFTYWHAEGHIEWNGNGPFVATLHAEVNAIRKAVQITGDANLSGAILRCKYDLRLPYAKG